MQASGLPPHVSQWRWTCSFYGKPGGDRESGVDLDDCKAKFRVAWSRIRARADGCGHREGARDAALTDHQHRGIRQTSLAANEV